MLLARGTAITMDRARRSVAPMGADPQRPGAVRMRRAWVGGDVRHGAAA